VCETGVGLDYGNGARPKKETSAVKSLGGYIVCDMKEKTLPFELRPTNIEGVDSFVPLPKGLDHRTVTNATLIKHGILVQRPDPIKNPALFQLWRKVIEEIWTEKNFTVPVLAPQGGITHGLRNIPRTNGGPIGGYTWSGCALVGSWSGVMGVWAIPAVSEPSTPQAAGGGWNSSSWVGLDGAHGLIPGTTSTDVLQAGVEQRVDASGNAHYTAWFEWYVPNPSAEVARKFKYVHQVNINSIPVKAGDEVSVVVQYVQHKGDEIGNPLPPPGPYSFGGVSFVNMTTNKSHLFYLKPPTGASFAGESAEWVMELPNDGSGSLPKFTSVTFENAGACNSQNTPPDLSKGDLFYLENYSGQALTAASIGEASVIVTYL
jgi:Peptidase A4 family